MKKLVLLCAFYLLAMGGLFAADDVIGFWKTVDEETQKPQSIIAIYEYQGKYYGRLVATYDGDGEIRDTIDHPRDRAPGVPGNPYFSGLDIMWDLVPEGNAYKEGRILDPEKGRVYDSEMWIENGNLVVRGKIFFIGRNQTWPPATDADFPKDFKKPDLKTLVPSVPELAK